MLSNDFGKFLYLMINGCGQLYSFLKFKLYSYSLLLYINITVNYACA